MTAKLKPLILPQLVQDRSNTRTPRKHDDLVCTVESIDGANGGNVANGTNGTPMFLGDNASVSDITSPATPTFSHRSGLGHLRYDSSSSSLDLPLSLPSPSYSECTSAPSAALSSGLGLGLGLVPATPSTNTANVNAPAPKRVLPDVQEEEALEQIPEDGNFEGRADYHDYDAHDAHDIHEASNSEDIEAMIMSHRISDLYDCLCDEPCTHGRANHSPASFEGQRSDYEIGFASDNDMPPASAAPYVGRSRRRTNGASMSALSDAAQRIGSQINVLSRWRSASASSRRAFSNLAMAPVSDPSLSHAPSSRSSSLSAGRPALVDLFNPVMNTNITPVIVTSSHSRFGSTDSIEQFPTTTGTMDDDYERDYEHDYDYEEDNDVARKSIERERTKATTPLLPPLFINTLQPSASPLPAPSVHTSPSQVAHLISPLNVADANIPPMTLSSPTSPRPSHPTSPITVVTPTDFFASPPLNRKLSSASVYHGQMSNHASNHVSAVASPLEPQDEWADRLGHANQTISPRPYHLPDGAGADELDRLCEDWAQARTNYAKHLMRMGEHYGTTSDIYELTKEKWSETECQWKAAYDKTLGRIFPNGAQAQKCAYTHKIRQHQDVSTMIPQIVDTEGKFPHSGDDEIVGPMDRIERDDAPSSEKSGMSKFLRGLAGRVRMRR